MAVEQLNFQGINRVVSDYGNAGACEELINLRPTGTGLAPVKPFGVQMAGVTYDKLYIHKAGAVTNYIAVKLDNGTLYIYRVSEAGAIIDTIAQIDVTGKTSFSVDQVHFAYTGNIILFSICDKADDFYKNLSYLWDGTSYVGKNYDIPDLNITISSSTTAEFVERSFADASNVYSYARSKVIDEHEGREAKEYLVNSCNQFEEEHKDYCFGAVIIAIAYRTKSGQTFFTNKWFVYDPELGVTENMHVVRYRSDMEIDGSHNIPYYFLLEQDPNGVVSVDDVDGVLYYPYTPVSQSGGDPSVYEKRLYNITQGLVGARVSLSFPKVSDDFDTEIDSIEIYSTRPQFYFEDIFVGQATVGTLFFLLKHREYDDMSLDNQLFYYQKSVQISELKSLQAGRTKDVQLQFGGNIQTTNRTLEVDAGPTTRYGRLLAYNSRYHFFNSIREVELGMPDFIFRHGGITQTHDVFAVYNDGQKDITAYLGTKELPSSRLADIVISPLSKVKTIITQVLQSGASYFTFQYEMEESQRYNYSICIGGGNVYIRNHITGFSSPIIHTEEPSAINVTEQYEPAVFKVEHSYLAPGAVLDIQPQMVAVRDVTYGDYPLNVFTNRGLYALLQGNGVVLYGAFRSISNLITSANAVPTEIGTFFIAAGNLWLVAGDNATLISDALNPGPHKFIRDSAGYKAIAEGQYDVSELVSQVPFDEYVNGATLAYNRYRDELFVSNPDYNYTYVLSLKHRQWFKMSLTLSQDVVGSDVATVPIGDAKNIVDFTDELETVEDTPVSVLVHYQTRPFSIGYQYIHVHRLLSMIRANLSTDDLLIVGLYGSDDLQDWKLLSYASRSGIKISQIRTPSAARSWRYYTVCVGGYCPWDTDFGTVLFDYQPVVRRIG